MVPSLSLTPPSPFVQYALVASTAMPSGDLWPEASVIGAHTFPHAPQLAGSLVVSTPAGQAEASVLWPVMPPVPVDGTPPEALVAPSLAVAPPAPLVAASSAADELTALLLTSLPHLRQAASTPASTPTDANRFLISRNLTDLTWNRQRCLPMRAPLKALAGQPVVETACDFLAYSPDRRIQSWPADTHASDA
jgi:hypothetical protein